MRSSHISQTLPLHCNFSISELCSFRYTVTKIASCLVLITGMVQMKSNSLDENIDVQISWVTNQIIKISKQAADSADIFKTFAVAVRAFGQLEKNLIISESDFIHFRDTYLSKVGIAKLRTTLRVYKNRQNNTGYDLQVTISNYAKRKLQTIVDETKMSKTEVLNSLLICLDLKSYQAITGDDTELN